MPSIRKRGKTWQVQVRIKEQGAIVYQESVTRDTKAAAMLWGLEREKEVKEYGWQKRVATKTTVRKLLDDYAQLKYRSKRMSRGVEHSLNALANDKDIGGLGLAELTSAKITQWAVKRQEAGNAPATVMHHLAMLRAAFNAAEGLFSIKADVGPVTAAMKSLRNLRVIAPSKKMENRITDADLEKILPEFKSDAAVIDMEKFVRVAIALPRRREELCTALRSNMAADGRTLKLVDTKDPRNYREEVVPVPPAALELLQSIPKAGEDDRFFPYKPESVSARWQRAVRRAGVPHLRLHDLRHEGISRLFETGLSIEEVALISGHTSWSTLKRYTHLRPQDVAEKLRSKHAGENRTRALDA